jgi:hypothetical protein
MKEKADHIESGCPKCVTGSVKECNEAEHAVKEQLLRLCRFDDCLREILTVKDESGDMVEKLSKIFMLAESALIPTVLCVSCKGLTTKSPCENCGAHLV